MQQKVGKTRNYSIAAKRIEKPVMDIFWFSFSKHYFASLCQLTCLHVSRLLIMTSLDQQITVMEHTMYTPKSGWISDLDTCDSYFSNRGPVTECVSKSEMTIEQAKQGHREQDHLSKLERRALKKARREGQLQTQGLCYPQNNEIN